MNSINEEWRPVDGYENYEVSNFGRVKSLGNDKSRKEKFLKPTKVRGYLVVSLYKDGKMKMVYVHRLIATAFIPNPEGFEQVNHKDEVKTNNCVENLEFCDAKYNMNYGTRTERAAAAKSKAVEASKYSDFREVELRFSSTNEADRNGYSSGAVSSCCRGCYFREGNNKYKGLFWRFAS